MSLASCSNVSIQFQERAVLDRVSFSIHPGVRLGVIGENGSGKSTILRLLAGEILPDSGQISVDRRARLWYQPQAARPLDSSTPLSAVLRLRPDLQDLLRRQAAAPASEAAELAAQYAAAGGWEFEREALRHLAALGIDAAMAERPLLTLSGGEQARAALAAALMSGADLLLLDEPDSHLDASGLAWLEQQLSSFHGTLLLVSHDRELLERTVNGILEVEDGAVRLEPGLLSEYLARKRQRQERQQQEYQLQQRRVTRLKEEIQQIEQQARKHEKLSSNDHWRRVGKKLAKTAVVHKRLLELELDATHRVERPEDRPSIRIGVAAARGAAGLLQLADISYAIGGRALLNGVTLELQRGERVALTGPNCSGKTTLLRIALGLQVADSGTVWRSTAPLVYIDQQQAGLDPALSALEQLRHSTGMSHNAAHLALARMLLRNREALKPVQALSGGERTRLLLAILSHAPAGLLVLDEPTNHLDIASMQVLEQALSAYNGGVLLVSHDRRLVTAIATRTLMLDDGRLCPA